MMTKASYLGLIVSVLVHGFVAWWFIVVYSSEELSVHPSRSETLNISIFESLPEDHQPEEPLVDTETEEVIEAKIDKIMDLDPQKTESVVDLVIQAKPVEQEESKKKVVKKATKVALAKPHQQIPSISHDMAKNKLPLNVAKTLNDAETQYKQLLYQLLAKAKFYPKKAKRRGYQGIVNVSFVIHADGLIDQIRIKTSSGRALLDKAAMKTVQTISLRLPFSEDIHRQQWVFDIPLEYKLL